MKKIKLIRLITLILLFSIVVPDFAPLAEGGTVIRTYTAPSAPIITAPLNDSIINDPTLTISGTVEAASRVEVFKGLTTLCTATVDGEGNWSCTTSSLEQGAHFITAKATDAAGNTSTASPPVNITIVTNNSPTGLAISSSTVEENQPVNTRVGILSATDPDAGDTFTYSLVAGRGDTDNNYFKIIGNQLWASPTFDYEVQNSYNIRIQVTDNGGLSFYKQFTITVIDVNENPIPTLVSMSPVDDIANISVNTNLSMTFSEDITPVAGKFITLYTSADSSIVETIDAKDSAVTTTGSTVTVNLTATLAYGTDYYVQIDAGAFKTSANQEYQGISIPTTWNFRTAEASTNANLSNLVLSNGTLNTAFSSSITSYTASVSNSVSNLTIIPTLADMNATIMVNGVTVKSGNASGAIALAVGVNTITVNVTAQDSTTKTYTVMVTRASSPQPAPQPVVPVPEPVPSPPANQISMQRVIENGVVSYRGNVTLENVQAILQLLANEDERIVRVIYPTDAATLAVTLEVQRAAVAFLANQEVDLFIQLANGTIRIPYTSLHEFTEELFFRIVPVKPEAREAIQENALQNEHVQAFVGNNMIVNLLGNPVTIETNLQNQPVMITLPISADATAEQIASLLVYIEHSDGTTEVKQGQIVELAPGVKGYVFETNHFSTFTLLYASESEVEEPQPEPEPEPQPQPEPEPEPIVLAPYIQGYSDGTFKPNAPVTRAQMATMLARFLTNNDIPTADSTFTDVGRSEAKDAIEFVKQTGLFNGTTQTTFDPNKTITRAQMARVITRWVEQACAENNAISYCQETGKGKVFTDVSTSHWAASSIEKVSALGIMSGNSVTTFNPKGALTRAQAVKVLNQLFERPAVVGITESRFLDVPANHWAMKDIETAATEIIFKK